jgi:hypothetical protein
MLDKGLKNELNFLSFDIFLAINTDANNAANVIPNIYMKINKIK